MSTFSYICSEGNILFYIKAFWHNLSEYWGHRANLNDVYLNRCIRLIWFDVFCTICYLGFSLRWPKCVIWVYVLNLIDVWRSFDNTWMFSLNCVRHLGMFTQLVSYFPLFWIYTFFYLLWVVLQNVAKQFRRLNVFVKCSILIRNFVIVTWQPFSALLSTNSICCIRMELKAYKESN